MHTLLLRDSVHVYTIYVFNRKTNKVVDEFILEFKNDFQVEEYCKRESSDSLYYDWE